MIIPTTVRICGLNYKVTMSENLYLEQGIVGSQNHNTLEILLQNHTIDKQKVTQTFFHEILHAIDAHYLDGKLTEEQVCQIANGFYQVLVDNDMLKGDI